MSRPLLLGAALAALTPVATAHDGALDSYGCHRNVAHGSYHCHEGLLGGRGYVSKEKMLEAYKARQQDERVRARAANPPQVEVPTLTTR